MTSTIKEKGAGSADLLLSALSGGDSIMRMRRIPMASFPRLTFAFRQREAPPPSIMRPTYGKGRLDVGRQSSGIVELKWMLACDNSPFSSPIWIAFHCSSVPVK